MKTTLFKRAMILGSALLIVIALLVGVALPGIAADNSTGTSNAQPAQPNILRGKVTAIAADKTSFTIQKGTETPIPIKVDANTKYYKIQLPIKFPAVASAKPQTALVPPSLKNKLQDKGVKERVEAKLKEKFQEKQAKAVERGLGQKKVQDAEETTPEITDEMINELELQGQAQGQQAPLIKSRINWLRQIAQKATFDDIALGDRTIVRVMPNENLAKMVLIIKQPKVKQVRGTITSLTATTIGITPTGGTEVVLSWDGNTRFVLIGLTAVQAGQGQIATAVYDTDTRLAKTVNVKKPVPTPTPTTTTQATT